MFDQDIFQVMQQLVREIVHVAIGFLQLMDHPLFELQKKISQHHQLLVIGPAHCNKRVQVLLDIGNQIVDIAFDGLMKIVGNRLHAEQLKRSIGYISFIKINIEHGKNEI